MTSTDTDDANYVSMENKAAALALARVPNQTTYFDGKMAGGPLGPFFTQKELTADEVKALYDLGRAALGV